MSYTLISMTGVKRGINQFWQPIGLFDYNIQSLFSEFRRVVMKLNDGSSVCYADLHQLQAQYAQWPDTLAALLGSLVSIVSTTTPPVINLQTAKWNHAGRANYAVLAWDAVYKDSIPVADRSDMLLTRDVADMDYQMLYKNCLVTVNGLYHLTDTNGTDGLIVYGGAKTARQSGTQAVGIHSFLPLGGLTVKPITTSMVFKRMTPEMIAGTMPVPGYKDLATITLPPEALGKVVMVVIGGYLHTPDSGVLRRVSDTEVEVVMSQLPIYERYFESSRYLDMSSLGLTHAAAGFVDVAELTSDAVMLKYLTMKQSFIVILNQASIFVNTFPVQKANVLGEYRTYNRPIYPLRAGLGRCPEYWWSRNDRAKHWELQCYGAAERKMIFDTTDPYQLTRITDTAYPADPEQLHQASFLEIGCDSTVL